MTSKIKILTCSTSLLIKTEKKHHVSKAREAAHSLVNVRISTSRMHMWRRRPPVA